MAGSSPVFLQANEPVFCYTIAMNIKLIVGGVIALALISIIAIGVYGEPEEEISGAVFVDENFVNTRPDVVAVPNTFSVMTPEEKAAADEAERLAAEAALAASSSATSTASSSEEGTDTEIEASVDEAE